MKKHQWIVIGSGILLLVALYLFGRTTPVKKPALATPATGAKKAPVEISQLLRHAKERLNTTQAQRIASLENYVTRGDVKAQQITSYKQLAVYWRDSVGLFEPSAYYTAEAAKLENSEKSLTFAAHLFLNSLKTESDPAMQNWLATNAKHLFEKSLELNPSNDSSKIGLGACYIFGNISDNPMEGISLVREVIQRNPENTFAQFVLGLGGIKSGQFDKAIERFLVVMQKEPDNLEAAINLAEAYDQKGDKANARTWYGLVKAKVSNPEAKSELEKRINALK